MARPQTKRQGRTLLEKRRIKREKRAAQLKIQRKRDRLEAAGT